VDYVICDADRVDDTHARKRQPLLACEPWDRSGEAKGQRVRAAAQKLRIEEPGHITNAHRAVRHPSVPARHLHQGLQPVRPAGACADDLHLQPARRRLARDGLRDIPRTERESTGIAGHIHRESHAGPVTSCGQCRRAARQSARESLCRAAGRRS
jgi:hypothetical protein